MNYQEENDSLIKHFLDRTYFRGWRDKEDERFVNFTRVEFYLNAKCNLSCKYCYHPKFGEQLYPSNLANSKIILKNLEMLLDWFIENDLGPDIDFFSGEPFVQKVAFDALNMILDKFDGAEKRPRFISIPTNYTFLLNDRLTGKVENLLSKAEQCKMPLRLSASFDGKYCEANRPFKSGLEKRNDGYYDKCFAFNKKYHFGFHPMIYSELIEEWIGNFLWFQENFRRFGISPEHIYLLEIRNAEWSDEQIKSYMKLIAFLIGWSFNLCHNNINHYLNFVLQGKGFNILSSPLTTTGRGLGCSFQSCLYIRMGDLAIIPCHRTSYSQNIHGNFAVKNNKITGIKARNVELLIGSTSFEHKCQPVCEHCMIKYLCQGQCLGSMYETTGDMFSPIPTVCKLLHAKVAAMVKAYKKLGIYDAVLDRVSQDKQISFRLVEREIKNGK